jgi:transcription factor IIIB subunit 2
MFKCHHCASNLNIFEDDSHGFNFCHECGKVFENANFSKDLQFIKGTDGKSKLIGKKVKDLKIKSNNFSKHEVNGVIKNQEYYFGIGYKEIFNLVDRLKIRPKEEIVEASFRLYRVVILIDFFQRKNISNVAATCCYIVCRQENKPFMLIDFSNQLQTNLFIIGNLFINLCKSLNLKRQPPFDNPVDPSLYINRFVDKLELGPKRNTVASIALNLVTSMKRNWIQTGRRPSSISAAALYMSLKLNHLHFYSDNVSDAFHITKVTIYKRILEFFYCDSSSLTKNLTVKKIRILKKKLNHEHNVKEEFQVKDSTVSKQLKILECDHTKLGKAAIFSKGMCLGCFISYSKLFGGVNGDNNPPSFLRSIKNSVIEKGIESVS